MKKIEYGTEFLDQLKDSVHQLYDENKELQQRLDDINYYIEQRCNEDINDIEKAILQSIILIANGTIKVVRDDKA